MECTTLKGEIDILRKHSDEQEEQIQRLLQVVKKITSCKDLQVIINNRWISIWYFHFFVFSCFSLSDLTLLSAWSLSSYTASWNTWISVVEVHYFSPRARVQVRQINCSIMELPLPVFPNTSLQKQVTTKLQENHSTWVASYILIYIFLKLQLLVHSFLHSIIRRSDSSGVPEYGPKSSTWWL